MAQKNYINLHNHTFYSDGRLSPAGVVAWNKKRGYRIIAITDHDSVEGIEEAIEAGKKLGVTVIPGIEMETKNFELLGLFIDHKNPELMAFLAQRKLYREAVLRTKIKYLEEKGIRVSAEDIRKFAGCQAIFDETIADFLVKKGIVRNNRIAMKLLKTTPLNKIKMVFRREIHSPSVKAVSRLISSAGGVPVLAHPFSYGAKTNFVTLPALIFFLKKKGVEGIETQTSHHGRIKAIYLAALAGMLSMKRTAGMDLHTAELIESERFARFKKSRQVEEFLKQQLGKARLR